MDRSNMTTWDMVPTPLSTLETAFHEAGHAYAFYKQGIDVEMVTIVASSSRHGGLCQEAFAGHPVRRIVAALAGAAAYELLVEGPLSYDEVLQQAGADLVRAERLARGVFVDRDLGEAERQNVSDPERLAYAETPRIQALADRLLVYCHGLSRALVKAGRGPIEAIATALVLQETLSGDEVAAAVCGAEPSVERDLHPRDITAGEQSLLVAFYAGYGAPSGPPLT